MSHPVPARRRVAATAGVMALALALSGCASGGQTAPSPAPVTSTPGVAASTGPAAEAAARIASAKAASSAAGSQRPEPREALETLGPGIRSGAATAGWQAIAASRIDTVSVMDCTKDVLDQATLDAVATHVPDANQLEIVQFAASRDEKHEFLTCTYNGLLEKSPGMPHVQIHYQHNLDGTRLDWCTQEPAAVADEYSFDPTTGKGLLALLRPGMVGGVEGAPLMPQRTAWACSQDGTQMVAATFGAMEGYGDANKGLGQVTDSPVATSTTAVTQTRDHLADTVLKDPSHFHDVIQKSSPFFLNAQMDAATLAKAQAIPTGRVPKEMLTGKSTINRPPGAPGPVAPGQPPRPLQGAAAAAAASMIAQNAAAAASASAAAAEGEVSPSPSP